MKTTQARRERSVLVAVFALSAALPTQGSVQDNGICDCNDRPSLGSFVTSDPDTYPPEIPLPELTGGPGSFTLTIPLPPDGVLVFDSFTADGPPTGTVLTVRFGLNDANTPVRLLVKDDFVLESSSFINIEGERGENASTQKNGEGGDPGPGGFRGGDGGSGKLVSATRGGPGQGPGGGAAGTPDLPVGSNDLRDGEDGTLSGSETLFPLVGGSGGGGGSGTGDDDERCTGGGGGGGAGAIIIAANGNVSLGGRILARGSDGGFRFDPNCSGGGGAGGPGAIRIVANNITGNEAIFANNGSSNVGMVRFEALEIAYTGTSTPPASRGLPGPIFQVLEPSLAITSVDGQSVSLPKGNVGEIDITTTSFDPITVQLMSPNIASNTTVEVNAKPRTGDSVVQETATLGDCDGSGNCTASVDLNLAPGVYFVEARATFQVASP